MDNNLDLTGLRTSAQTAGNDLTNLQSSTPKLLQDLKTSLTSVFAKDNPYIAERNKALETFLNVPTQTRAELMPENLPVVAGTHLNLSPTQQDAITTARSNAALAPLLGLNQTVTGLYGNIGDILSGYGTTLQAQTQAAQTRAQLAQQLYQNAIQEYNARTQAGYGGNILNYLGAGGYGGGLGGNNRPPLESFDTPDTTSNIPTFNTPQQATNYTPTNILNPYAPTWWENIPLIGGALQPIFGNRENDIQRYIATNSPTKNSSSLSGYNFGNLNFGNLPGVK